MRPRVLMCTLALGSLVFGTAPSSFGVAYRSLGVTCGDDSGSLGASGASSVGDCQDFCSVDPRCNFVVYQGTQCSWSASCGSPSAPSSGAQSFVVANRTVPGVGWFWASADDLDLDGRSRAATTVLASGTMSVADAMAACAAAPNCTSFGLISSSGPLNKAADIQTYTFDAAQIVDPSQILGSTYIYYKNASSSAAQRAYCDLQLMQNLVNAGAARSTTLGVTWTHCSTGLFAQLHLAGHGAVGAKLSLSQALVPFSTGTYGGNGTLTVGADVAPAVGQQWSVIVASSATPTLPPLQSLPITVAASVCDAQGAWPASTASAEEPVSLPCWSLNESWAIGTATRRCVAGHDFTGSGQLAQWAAVDATNCSAGRWSHTELGFLSGYAATSSDGGAAIIGGHTRPIDPVSDYFLWLSYFPGNRVYGLEWNEDLTNCPASDGSEDIPGNMAAPPFRRLKVGAFMQQRQQRPCIEFARSLHVSIQQSSSGTAELDRTLNVARATNGSISVVVVQEHEEQEEAEKSTAGNNTLGLRAEVLPWREWSLLRLTIWDLAEARCYAELDAMCGAQLGSGHSCSLCALEHLRQLTAAGCTKSANWANVVTFWCGCDSGGGLADDNSNSCGGPPYQDALGSSGA
jgi:hypothetical protein